MGSEPGALCTDRVLGHLDDQGLPLVHQSTDRFHGTTFPLGNFRSMDEGRSLQSDIDKGSLHTRQYADDLAL